jgi:hypothetical protein
VAAELDVRLRNARSGVVGRRRGELG